jgi:hypothetical protein
MACLSVSVGYRYDCLGTKREAREGGEEVLLVVCCVSGLSLVLSLVSVLVRCSCCALTNAEAFQEHAVKTVLICVFANYVFENK